MQFDNAESLFDALLKATSSDALRQILAEIGDDANVELDQSFGPLGFSWHAFGDNESNISAIGLGTKPGRSLTERLTNAMDAILEDRTPANVTLPPSAREAAKQWFGRPVSGPDEGLFQWRYGEHNYDRRISVVMCDSGVKAAPTVDVFDEGIGIAPADIPTTILSLHQGNKSGSRTSSALSAREALKPRLLRLHADRLTP